MHGTDPYLIPVIAGIGEMTDRESVLEPRALINRAVRTALAGAPGLGTSIDSLDMIAMASFRYADVAALVAGDCGLNQRNAVESGVGGEKPIRLLGEAAERIVAGTDRAAIICGGEAMRTRAQAAKRGETLTWGPADPAARPSNPLDYVTLQAARHGLTQPTNVYPLYENATRHRWKQKLAESQAESAALWHHYSQAAARNDYAWLRQEFSPRDIDAETTDNRMIAFPYRKLMVANPMVNQAAAVLVTSLGRARDAGLADADLIFIASGARADEPKDFLTRDRFDHSAAQDEVLAATLAGNRLSAGDIDLWELYSCFPTVPKMARRTLGLARDFQPSVTGGLTFFGAPANNYMTHAITATVRALRRGEGDTALLYGQGEFVTKHAAILLSRNPPARPPQMQDVQSAADRRMGPLPQLLATYEGPAMIESYTLICDRAGAPAQAPVILRTPNGARAVALGDLSDRGFADWLTDPDADPVGAKGSVRVADDATLRFARI